MKYIIKQVKDELTLEEALSKARSIYKKLEKELEEKLPMGIIYGINHKGKAKYFYEPIVCITEKELLYEKNKLIEKYPNSTILTLFKASMQKDSFRETVTLHYDNLDITLLGKYHEASWGDYGGEPGYYDEIELSVDYDYEADKDDVLEELFEIVSDESEFINKSGDEIESYIEENFEKLVEKYKKELKKYFEDYAKREAIDYWQEKYDEPENNY